MAIAADRVAQQRPEWVIRASKKQALELIGRTQTKYYVHAIANTDEWPGYNHIERQRVTVNHGEHEWTRDDDGDGIRAVHINATKGTWTGARDFLCHFCDVHKDYLVGYVAMCEHRVNLKCISPQFIAHSLEMSPFYMA